MAGARQLDQASAPRRSQATTSLQQRSLTAQTAPTSRQNNLPFNRMLARAAQLHRPAHHHHRSKAYKTTAHFRLRPVAGTQDLTSVAHFHPAAAVQTTFLQTILPAATGLQWAAELILCAPSDPSFLLPSTFPMYSFALSAHIVSFTTPTDPSLPSPPSDPALRCGTTLAPASPCALSSCPSFLHSDPPKNLH
jgi:hypothetical protein